MLKVVCQLGTREDNRAMIEELENTLEMAKTNYQTFKDAERLKEINGTIDDKFRKRVLQKQAMYVALKLVLENKDFLFQETEEDCDPDNDFTVLEEELSD